ncbi:MAG: hypothetical protein C0490_01955 [Marivirga sp.]|nr:hypothetical protein [Marivirga sp.]
MTQKYMVISQLLRLAEADFKSKQDVLVGMANYLVSQLTENGKLVEGVKEIIALSEFDLCKIRYLFRQVDNKITSITITQLD